MIDPDGVSDRPMASSRSLWIGFRKSVDALNGPRADWYWFFIFLGLAVLLRLPFISLPFDNDSSATAYHARLIVRGEPLYGSHHTGHHLPGVYYLFAAAFAMLGDQVESVKVLLIGWVAGTAFLVYRLGAALSTRAVGVVAGAFSLVLFSSIHLFGTSARFETFIGLPQTAAVLALALAIRPGGNSRTFFWVGLFSGITIQFKASHIAPLLLAAAVLLALWLKARSEKGAFGLALRRFGWGMGGGIAAGLPTILYFYSEGLLPRFWQVFEIGLGYTRTAVSSELGGGLDFILFPLAILGRANPAIVVMAMAALYGLLRSGLSGKVGGTSGGMFLVAAWLGLCFLETGMARTFFPHYYVVMVPSLSLLAASLLVRLAPAKAKGAERRWRAVVLGLLVGSAAGWSMAKHWNIYAQYYGGYLLGDDSYEEFMRSGLPGEWGETTLAIQELAEYVRDRTEPNDRVYFWSNFVEMYYLADRLAPTDIIWPLYVDATGSRDRVFTAEYVIIGDPVFGYDAVPEWLTEGLDRGYELETTRYEQRFYRKKPGST